MSITGGVVEGFHYPIYTTTLVGGGPEQWVFSPADQVRADGFAKQRVEKFLAEITRDFAEQGLLQPVRPMALPEENGAGDIISVSA